VGRLSSLSFFDPEPSIISRISNQPSLGGVVTDISYYVLISTLSIGEDFEGRATGL
jgi:hypothetical protein